VASVLEKMVGRRDQASFSAISDQDRFSGFLEAHVLESMKYDSTSRSIRALEGYHKKIEKRIPSKCVKNGVEAKKQNPHIRIRIGQNETS
jgi:hypothetical protein